MNKIIFSLLLFLPFINAESACSSKRDILRKVEAQKSQLEVIRPKLQMLLSGTWTSGADISSLFTTNISTREEQKLRYEEIEKSLLVAPYINQSNIELHECLDQYKLQSLSQDLSELSYEIDKNRYFYLTLPTQVQKILTDSNKPVPATYEDIRQLQERLLIVKKTKPDFFEQEIELLSQLINRLKINLEASSSLLQIKQGLKNGQQTTELYSRVNQLWRSLVDQTFQTLNTPELSFPSEQENKEREAELKKEADIWVQKGIERQYLILVEAGKLRSQLAERNNKNILDSLSWQDIKREIKIVPYRFTGIFYSKIVDIRQKLRLGFNGIGLIVRDLFMLLIIILIPFGLKRVFERIATSLDQVRNSILQDRKSSGLLKALAIWIQRLKPFIPWMFWYITLVIGEKILLSTVLAEVAALFPYFRYFVLYKVFRRLVMLFLTSLSARSDKFLSKDIKIKATATAKSLGQFAFISFVILHAVDSIVSKGIIYEVLLLVIKVLALLQVWRWSTKWSQETSHAIRGNLTSNTLKIFNKIDSTLPKFIVAFPWIIFSLVIEAFKLIQSLGSDFDLSKRLSAQVFKRQLENVEELAEEVDSSKLPAEYIELFPSGVTEDEALLIEPDDGILEQISKEVEEWKSGKSDEHSIAIFGDKGSGKSTALLQLSVKNKDIRVVGADIPSKLLTRDEVLKFFGNLIQADLTDGGRSLVELDKELEPTLILLDETQNLFLSKVGGFEAYKTLLELISTRTNNIFWVASFNRYSWAFLNAVFGKNQQFRAVVKVRPWKDEDIKTLIMTRHKKGSYELSFDAILQAVGNSRVEDAAAAIESKFFKLLWEQSGGNPRAAQELWISSLLRIRSKTLRVGLPDDPELSVLSDLSDDALFVYSALIRHENLSTNEMVEVTDLPEGTVRYALRLGLENEFLNRTENGRYRVVADSQRKLITYLRKRNFIYGG